MELPPRARRIQYLQLNSQLNLGTTSACAENTYIYRNAASGGGNYLRVRGEYGDRIGFPNQAWELPPRARRIHLASRFNRHFRGTTSACAENTPKIFCIRSRFWNYLRVRGEYWGSAAELHKALELPPRARRIRDPLKMFANAKGTTSACAENTSHRRNHV